MKSSDGTSLILDGKNGYIDARRGFLGFINFSDGKIYKGNQSYGSYMALSDDYFTLQNWYNGLNHSSFYADTTTDEFVSIYCDGVRQSKALNVQGKCEFNATNMINKTCKKVIIHGLNHGMHTINKPNDTINLYDDIVIFRAGASGSYALPNASDCMGKVLFMKKIGSGDITITGTCVNANNSSTHTSSTNINNGVSLMYVCDGLTWIMFFCG